MHHLPGEHLAPGCTMGKSCAARGSVLLWAVFCWEAFCPGIKVDVILKFTTYLSTVADDVHPFMEIVFPDGRGLFQYDNVPQSKNGSEMI